MGEGYGNNGSFESIWIAGLDLNSILTKDPVHKNETRFLQNESVKIIQIRKFEIKKKRNMY